MKDKANPSGTNILEKVDSYSNFTPKKSAKYKTVFKMTMVPLPHY